jgi:hypothetical protein
MKSLLVAGVVGLVVLSVAVGVVGWHLSSDGPVKKAATVTSVKKEVPAAKVVTPESEEERDKRCYDEEAKQHERRNMEKIEARYTKLKEDVKIAREQEARKRASQAQWEKGQKVKWEKSPKADDEKWQKANPLDGYGVKVVDPDSWEGRRDAKNTRKGNGR